jgi:hypothetical protein
MSYICNLNVRVTLQIDFFLIEFLFPAFSNLVLQHKNRMANKLLSSIM